MTVWRVTPPDLMTWLPPEKQGRAIALFDLEPDILPTGETRLDLRIAFKCIPVRHEGFLTHADFYIGCTSASVHVEIECGSLVDYTPDTHLSVNYKDTETRTRASKAVVEPSASAKGAGEEAQIKLGTLSFEMGTQSQFERSFVYEERVLAAVCTGNGVTWRLDPPSKLQAIRDFLFGNVHLFALCRFDSKSHRGKITVRPSDITFYDPNRRPYTRAKSLILLYALYRARRRLFRPRGVTVSFEGEP